MARESISIGSLRRLMALAVLLLAMVAAPVMAASDRRADANDSIALKPCIKPIAAADRAGDLIGRSAAFDCRTKQTQFGSGDYWVRLSVPEAAPPQLHYLRWTSVWQNSAAITIAYADGSRETVAVPTANSGRYVHVGGYYTVPLRRDTAAHTILFEIKGSGNMRGILLGPMLASSDAVTAIDVRRGALYGGFAGLCLALLAYNLMMWRAMRETYLLAYCGMVVASLAYAFTSSAAVAQIYPLIDNNVRLRFNYAFLALTAIFALWFVRQFFGDKMFSRRFDRSVYATTAAIGGSALAFAILAPWQVTLLDRLYFASYALLFIVGAGIFVRGWRRGEAVDRLFVIAWALPFLFNALRMLHGFGLVPQSFWLDNATLVAMSAEALLSSMIIAHRIRFMRADRDAARADEAEARHLADTDALTGLLNRRALMRAACPRPDAAGQYRLILIDIDHFKAINDSAGHSAGDVVLQKVAAVIRSSMRPDVIAARIGGEEFALLFATGNVDRRYYSSLLARIRALSPVGGQRITISMGAANGWLGGSEGEWLALYRAADAALYEAKNSGRNRLIVAPRYRDLAVAS